MTTSIKQTSAAAAEPAPALGLGGRRLAAAESGGGALRAMMKDENGQAMVEFVMMLAALTGVTIVINLIFNQLVEDQMRLFWDHIIYPCLPIP